MDGLDAPDQDMSQGLRRPLGLLGQEINLTCGATQWKLLSRAIIELKRICTKKKMLLVVGRKTEENTEQASGLDCSCVKQSSTATNPFRTSLRC
jgi:hypothetical protein